MPLVIREHSMVQLGNGQAILGGYRGNRFINSGYGHTRLNGAQTRIYYLTCINRNCKISLLNKVIRDARKMTLVIPIPDNISGCITGGKESLEK